MLQKIVFFALIFGLQIPAFAEIDSAVEKILIANNFTSAGHMQDNPSSFCSLQVIPPKNLPSDENPYWVKARSIHLWLVAFPGGQWELDARQSILRRSIDGNPSWFMAYHFDPQTLKFKRFYETKNNASSAACILGE